MVAQERGVVWIWDTTAPYVLEDDWEVVDRSLRDVARWLGFATTTDYLRALGREGARVLEREQL